MDVLGGLTALLLLGTGAYFTVRLRGFFFLHPVRAARVMLTPHPAGRADARRTTPAVPPAGALCMALAGTLGVGNIVGVASALRLGGPGAVLWMIIGALCASVLKYAEILLAVRHRRIQPDGIRTGGAPCYIRDALTERGHARAGRILAGVFSVLCLAGALTMGSMLQVNAAAGALEEAFRLPPWITGAALALLTAAVMSGGTRRIAALTEKLVPLMAGVFLALCAGVLILRHERIPAALSSIVRSAFTLRAAGVGAAGAGLTTALRYGIMRGLLSNEAGCGTAPMAHAAADTDSPAAQGLLGVCEVLVDTVLLCTVTALTILVSDSGPDACGPDAVRTAESAFTSVLGRGAGGVFAVSVALFAAATVFCWSHYGLCCARALRQDFGHERTGARRSRRTPSPGELVFILLFCAAAFLGANAAPALCWQLADASIGLMTIINLCILLLCREEITEETRRAGLMK